MKVSFKIAEAQYLSMVKARSTSLEKELAILLKTVKISYIIIIKNGQIWPNLSREHLIVRKTDCNLQKKIIELWPIL